MTLSHHRTYGSRIRRFVKHTIPALYTRYGFSLLFDKASTRSKPINLLIEFQSTQRSALHYLVRPPISIGSFPVATMASADFSDSISWSPRSPQVRTSSFPQYPLDLLQRHLMVSHPLDVDMMCCLIRPLQPQYPVPVRWNQGLCQRHPFGAVSLPSLYASQQTSLRLANASGHDSHA